MYMYMYVCMYHYHPLLHAERRWGEKLTLALCYLISRRSRSSVAIHPPDN